MPEWGGAGFEENLRAFRCARVVERQTREFEGLVVEIPCGFKSRPSHQSLSVNAPTDYNSLKPGDAGEIEPNRIRLRSE